jgi:oxalate decarboxylase/phosphoglucose isomerase-like protein (cupin superfamily)
MKETFEKYNVNGELVVDHEDYKIWDNTTLKTFTVSNVLLKAGKKTYSHQHPFNDEIYIFHSGTGYMTLKREFEDSVKTDNIAVGPGSVVLVDGRQEHQTFNTGDTDMQFTMIYDNIGRPPKNIDGIEQGEQPYEGD